ncbi:agamous-like MADS-box protein AGL30 [Ananas comosus]|uniref:Agamous-like MADS-box protein AGL30 n=1 Tax=Ananas comosus TaxID=4615 RepID=A0A6P5GT79_ANACO|nr:agamous-like MADS-box protein AGL30 [Ananas comosus]
MGYTKVPMEARDTLHHRKKTYRKRHPVLKRRVEELGVLCEADAVLLMFSPSGHPSLFCGGTSDLAEILEKYSKVDPTERENRKNEVIAVRSHEPKLVGYI